MKVCESLLASFLVSSVRSCERAHAIAFFNLTDYDDASLITVPKLKTIQPDRLVQIQMYLSGDFWLFA
jgi:hypothetical protein